MTLFLIHFSYGFLIKNRYFPLEKNSSPNRYICPAFQTLIQVMCDFPKSYHTFCRISGHTI